MPAEFHSLPQAKKFYAPLQPGDMADETAGPRDTGSSIYDNNSPPGACAFVRGGVMRERPPASCANQFANLCGPPPSAGAER